jgi:hypothetical protein
LKNEHFAAAEITPIINSFGDKFRAWYEKYDLKLCLPNFHNLTCHLVEQVKFQGPPWSMTTQLDEKFHQLMKAIIQNNLNGFALSRDTLAKV